SPLTARCARSPSTSGSSPTSERARRDRPRGDSRPPRPVVGLDGPEAARCLLPPFVYSLLAFLGLSRAHRPSLTEWDEVLAKDRAKVDGLLGSEEGVRIQLVAGGGRNVPTATASAPLELRVRVCFEARPSRALRWAASS